MPEESRRSEEAIHERMILFFDFDFDFDLDPHG